ncbi:MAG: MltA domain-containing protein [Sterolibacteriaceae bacterium]|nr:MltA domain-containing protein [Sterolibacteriaceae bacterium]MBK9087258.1 MltA domain-containing protein [Sterolibacteriaceae bacterium]
MQIQGSGKVRLPDGKIVRLSYGEQNGHPFTPPAGKGNRGGKKGRVTTRGLSIDLPDVEDEMAGADQNAGQPLTRGGRAASAPRPVPRADEPSAADVERLVEQLATGKPATIGPRRPPARVAAAGGVPVSAVARFPQPSAALVNAISADPSYVFFREIPDGPEGPIGALGVALTAGRSVAVDPRTTPLGYPVFMSTGEPGQTDSLNRLVMAQDTGGAIRGAVRADYFWGFGAAAYEQAANMKESGRMWLMLPHGQQVAARDQALRTRGAAGGRSDLECVIADPDLCVEDR